MTTYRLCPRPNSSLSLSQCGGVDLGLLFGLMGGGCGAFRGTMNESASSSSASSSSLFGVRGERGEAPRRCDEDEEERVDI